MPSDSHVHSEWSWDTGGPRSAAAGTMARTCARAVEIGLPALAVTDHLDVEGWLVGAEDARRFPALVHDGRLRPPPLEIDGYLAAVDRCRAAYPQLRVLTGVELGEPHLVGDVAGTVDLRTLDRVVGSLHMLPVGEERAEPRGLYEDHDPADVVHAYLEEMVVMAGSGTRFDVVAHLDYAVRSWPTARAGAFDVTRFEDGFRQAMRAIARSGRALEMSAALLQPWMPRWWAEEGGRAVSFASDAHVPDALGVRFGEAVAMVEAAGFRPGARPEDLWRR